MLALPEILARQYTQFARVRVVHNLGRVHRRDTQVDDFLVTVVNEHMRVLRTRR